jgi:hypothetical protein
MNVLFYDWCLNRARVRLCDPQYMGVVSKRQLETGASFEEALEAEARAVVRRVAEAQAGKHGRRAQQHAIEMEQVWRQNRSI